MALEFHTQEVKIHDVYCGRCGQMTRFLGHMRDVNCANKSCGVRLIENRMPDIDSLYGPGASSGTTGSAGVTGGGLRFCALHRESWNPAAYGECPRCFGPGSGSSLYGPASSRMQCCPIHGDWDPWLQPSCSQCFPAAGPVGRVGKGHDKTPLLTSVTYYTTPRELVLLCPI